MRRQFNEENRPNIEVEFLYVKRAFYGLRFINHRKCTAQQVEICLDSAFINSIAEKSFSDLLKNKEINYALLELGNTMIYSLEVINIVKIILRFQQKA